MGDEWEMCQNCKRDIPLVNYQMHMLHCSRNVILCPQCDEPVPKSSIQEHDEEFHRMVECDKCQEQINLKALPAHKESFCLARAIECRFCHLETPAKEQSEHEDYCGSRTEKCPQCNDFVKLKDWDEHEKMTLYHELAKKPCAQVFGYKPLANDPTWRPKVPFPSSLGSSFLNSSNSFNAIDNKIYSTSTKARGATSTSTALPPTWQPRTTSSSSGKFDALRKTHSLSSQDNSHFDADLDGLPELETVPKASHHSVKATQGVPGRRRKSSAVPSLVDQVLGNRHQMMMTSGRRGGVLEMSSTESPAPSGSWFIGDHSTSPPATGGHNSSRGSEEGETLIPCEFCDTPIPLIRLIKHQTQCTRNMDSLYFNAHLPTRADDPKIWPQVVTDALYDRSNHDELDGNHDDSGMPAVSSSPADLNASTRRPYARASQADPLVDWEGERPRSPPPPTLPPKKSRAKSSGREGLQIQSSTHNNSIVSKYLGEKLGPRSRKASNSGAPPARLMHALIDFGDNSDPISFTTSDSDPATRGIEDGVTPRAPKSHPNPHQRGAIPKRSLGAPTRPPRSALPSSKSQPGLCTNRPRSSATVTSSFLGNLDSEATCDHLPPPSPEEAPEAWRGTRSWRPDNRSDVYNNGGPSRTVPAEPVSDAHSDLNEREKLREMLATLRKDPFDEDLENNDGSFFPCEFCGDPYPSEFIMRHQLSCDLNPRPVTSGEGFDYSKIRNRVKENMELAKNIPEIK